VKRLSVRILSICIAAFTLAGCIESSAPIIPDAEPEFGERVQFQLYGLRDGGVRDPQTLTLQWNGGLYAHAGGGLRELSGVSFHPFENGGFIIQTVSVKRPQITEYALAHKLIDGVFFVAAIDETDADEATRTDYCKKAKGAACSIETREQLMAFARATAARSHQQGAIALRVSTARSAPERRAPPRRH
jgi:hypothetical protein